MKWRKQIHQNWCFCVFRKSQFPIVIRINFQITCEEILLLDYIYFFSHFFMYPFCASFLYVFFDSARLCCVFFKNWWRQRRILQEIKVDLTMKYVSTWEAWMHRTGVLNKTTKDKNYVRLIRDEHYQHFLCRRLSNPASRTHLCTRL